MTTGTNEQHERRRAGALILGSALVSAVGVAGLAFTTTSAAFSGTTENTGNSFDAATVVLTDDDGGAAMFAVADMIPGDVVSDCIEITYEGTTTDLSDLRVYGTSAGNLVADLDLTISHDGAGSTCQATKPATVTSVYTGDLGSLGADFASGTSGFVPTAQNETVAYYFDIELDAATANSQQGESATADFTWEVRSN